VGSEIMRYYSYLFHGLLALFLAGVSGVALMSSPRSLHLDMLPWTGATLTYTVFFAGLFGLLAVVLAAKRTLPALLLLWSLAVAVMLIYGYVFTGYTFSPGEVTTAAALIAGSLIAIPGPWLQMRRRSVSWRATTGA
jgi:hypothetical protein